ncbi:MAG TPA: tRNA uridine-5-carboxymethylaminomethyl(34) synthesis enzyme MnmG, partial [Gammaproteobacteria bacterium]|nr:tRNA uridine-5-carboxymethylaminomethyl(34) synthesis enzyme MnmG [Gammaproteobacteria bacterium]
EEASGQALAREYSMYDILKRPEVDRTTLAAVEEKELSQFDDVVLQQIEIECKYDGYIQRQKLEVDRMSRSETTVIPDSFKFEGISGLSNEVIQKLNEHRPSSLGQASRIPGVTPAAVSLLAIALKRTVQVV